MQQTYEYDVFLSHGSHDKDIVRALAECVFRPIFTNLMRPQVETIKANLMTSPVVHLAGLPPSRE